MPIQIECPGCKATIQVGDELAGKQGKCAQCGHRLTVPGRGSVGVGLSQTLFEATPEAMVRELFRRDQSAMLLVFPLPSDGSYDLSKVPEGMIKCIATEDINQARFGQLVTSFAQRYAPRKKAAATASVDEQLYELKGDRLGMPLEEFKKKYERGGEGGVRLPLCSDTAWGANKAALHTEPWHAQAGIVNARIDLPAEDNSPTVAGVKTELLLYQFIDGKLFRIVAQLPTDRFHVFTEATIKKFGQPTRETQKPRQLVWENSMAWVSLTRGSVHPPESSVLELAYRPLHQMAASRMPTGLGDI